MKNKCLAFTCILLFLVHYQGCTQQPFSVEPTPLTKSSIESFQLNVDTDSKIDILFVLDESASMSAIIDNVRAGITSLSQVYYPNNTRMAVTNMAPATYDPNAPGGVAFDEPYKQTLAAEILASPGYMQLVTKDSIAGFLEEFPGRKINFFDLPGCDGIEESGLVNGWFLPLAKDSNQQPCIKGATQIARYGTGYETGATAYTQFLIKLNQSHLSVFRKDALAHIVFISDTHEPGASGYYGKPGAGTRIPNMNEIKSKTLANSPNIKNLSLSGIVPLPIAGDQHLEGVTVIGDLPTQVGVTGEGMWDYAYLPLIKESGGVAIHTLNNNWNSAMEKLIQVTQNQQYEIRLSRPATKIRHVWINNEDRPSSDYLLKGDQMTLVLLMNLQIGKSYTVDVEFEYEEAPAQ